MAKEANRIIRTLERSNFYCTCPSCEADFSISEAGLFYSNAFTSDAREVYEKKWDELREQARSLQKLRRKVTERSEAISQAVNIGFNLERIAPSMADFPFSCNDCRSLFDPIDYIVFKGLCNEKKVNGIVFLEIKTGIARLTDVEGRIRELVRRKRVVWDTYEPVVEE